MSGGVRPTALIMTVRCPNCSTGYLLPDHLIGPRGARVRCPRCEQTFVVPRESVSSLASGFEREVERSAPSGAPTTPEPARALGSGRELAERVLEDLAGRLRASPADAFARGRLFSALGPTLLDAFDDYRRRAGSTASAAEFRSVLSRRWGIGLTPDSQAD